MTTPTALDLANMLVEVMDNYGSHNVRERAYDMIDAFFQVSNGITSDKFAEVDYAPLLAALRANDSEAIDAAYADIQTQVYGSSGPVRHDADGMGGDFFAAMESK